MEVGCYTVDSSGMLGEGLTAASTVALHAVWRPAYILSSENGFLEKWSIGYKRVSLG